MALGSMFNRPVALLTAKCLQLAHSILTPLLAVTLILQPVSAATPPALPTAGNFVAGSGAIAISGNGMTINQSSLRGIIDWTSFNIGSGGTVLFHNGAGVTLNRVTGASPSLIVGSLQADGSVYLLNSQGVLIGKGGRINTGGDFVASTFPLSNDAFLKGGAFLFGGSSAASVKNLGAISSDGGSIFLIARAVENQGALQAAKGTVGMGAGQTILLKDSTDDQRIFVQARGGDVTNTGSIAAAEVELKAAQGNIYALAGNNTGRIRATGTATKDGHVWLVSTGGHVQVAGTLSAHNADGAGEASRHPARASPLPVRTSALAKTAPGCSIPTTFSSIHRLPELYRPASMAALTSRSRRRRR